MRIIKLAALAVTALVSIAAGNPHPNWTATVTVAEDGSHILGNTQAQTTLTEYVSYTCPHCSTFQKQSDAPLRLAYVMPGKLSLQVRHLVRDPVDLTVAMLTNCGDPQGFFKRHHTFLYGQEEWFSRMGGTSEGQRTRWTTGPVPARLKAVARDFDFYSMMVPLGFTRSEVDKCLADEAMLDTLMEQTKHASQIGVRSTPSFALDGVLLAGTHDWETLDFQIQARM